MTAIFFSNSVFIHVTCTGAKKPLQLKRLSFIFTHIKQTNKQNLLGREVIAFEPPNFD